MPKENDPGPDELPLPIEPQQPYPADIPEEPELPKEPPETIPDERPGEIQPNELPKTS